MLKKIRSSLARAIAPVDYNAYNRAFFQYLGLLPTGYDVNGKTYIDKGFNINGDVFSIVSQKATKCSDIPFYVKKVKDEKGYSQYKRLKPSTNFGQFTKKVVLQTKAFDGEEIPMPLERPNPLQTWSEFVALASTFYDCTGNLFLYMVRAQERENAEPYAIYVLPSHQVSIVIKDNADLMTTETPIDHYMLTEGVQYIDFREQDVIHIKEPNPNFDFQGSHLYGFSPLRAVLKNIQSSNEAKDNNIKTLKNGGAFGFLHSKGQNVMSPDQAKSLKERLIEMDNDPERLGKLAGVSAEIGFTRIALTTDELKPFDYLKYDQQQITNALKWSIELLNDRQSSTGINNGSLEAALKWSVINGCMPFLNKLEEGLNSKFLPLFPSTKGAKIEFDHTELPEMQDDMEKLTKWLYQGLDRGVFTRRMVLESLKYPVDDNDPNLDIRTVSGMGLTSLDDALIPLENDLIVNDDD